jgi:hypothetical protein
VTTDISDRSTPLDAGRRSLGPECASDLALDRLAAAEVDEAERGRLNAHLASCAACAGRNATLIADRAQFAAQAAFANLAADAVMRSQKGSDTRSILLRRFFLPFGLVGAMGLISVLMAGRHENRTKGEFSLSTYVLHPERGTEGSLHLGEPLHPGDKLQFRYNGTRDGNLTIVAVDESGKVSVYYPPTVAAAPVTAGHDVPLSSAVELDATLGREVIVGVRCDAPLAVDEIANAARAAVAAARAKGAAATDFGPLGLSCVETRHQITKVPRPAP